MQTLIINWPVWVGTILTFVLCVAIHTTRDTGEGTHRRRRSILSVKCWHCFLSRQPWFAPINNRLSTVKDSISRHPAMIALDILWCRVTWPLNRKRILASLP